MRWAQSCRRIVRDTANSASDHFMPAEVAFSTPFGTFEPKGMDVRIAASGGGADQGPRTVDAISTDDAVNFGDG